MLKIGEFSKLAQVSVKTLRYYDELDLLRPEWVDRYTGYRYYALQQLPRLNRLLALRELGFSLVQIERLLREDLPASELQRLMKLRHAELEHQVQVEQERLARVAVRLHQIEQEGRQPRYEVVIKQVEPQLVAGIRDTIADRRDVVELVDELRSFVRNRGDLSGPLSPLLAVYFDAEYLDRGADVEVALPLARRLRGAARVSVHELPAIPVVASAVHTGSHDRLPAAYRGLMGWTKANGYRSCGSNREIYLRGFEAGSDPNSWVTELQLPVQHRSVQPGTGYKEEQVMEPRIVNKPTFTVVGLPFTGLISSAPYEGAPDKGGNENNEIGPVWDEFNRRYTEIQHVCGPAYGLCFGMPNVQEPWYIAGAEVARVDELPTGMMSMSVPAQRYAVFPCTLSALGATYRYIVEEWQPQSGYEHADAPDFEYYDQEFDPAADPRNMKLSVYWPIK